MFVSQVAAVLTARHNDILRFRRLHTAAISVGRHDRLFRWLPIYNLTVIALTLAYQAPLHELTFGKWTAAHEVRYFL